MDEDDGSNDEESEEETKDEGNEDGKETDDADANDPNENEDCRVLQWHDHKEAKAGPWEALFCNQFTCLDFLLPMKATSDPVLLQVVR